VGLAASVLAGLVLIAGTAAATQSAGSLVVPKSARKLLDDKWPGWQVAGTDGTSSCQPGTPAPAAVNADLDGDARTDIAAAIKTPAGIRLVAVLDRLDKTSLQDVDALSSDVMWTVRKRGTKYRTVGSPVDDYFGEDTLVIQRCGGKATAYFWTGSAFHPQAIE